MTTPSAPSDGPPSATPTKHAGRTDDSESEADEQFSDKYWMKKAIELAQQAASEGEVPVGALVVSDHLVVGQGYNQRESLKNPVRHAEITAIEKAAEQLQAWRLSNCTLYVTLEPCPMCAGAILNSRIPRVVFGTSDPKAGAVSSLFELLNDSRLNHRCEVTSGVLADQCSGLLTEFFKTLRTRR